MTHFDVAIDSFMTCLHLNELADYQKHSLIKKVIYLGSKDNIFLPTRFAGVPYIFFSLSSSFSLTLLFFILLIFCLLIFIVIPFFLALIFTPVGKNVGVEKPSVLRYQEPLPAHYAGLYDGRR